MREEEAKAMLEALREHYREPVMPMSAYCNGLEAWMRVVEEKMSKEGKEGRFGGLDPGDLRNVQLAIHKSNLLLSRLLYAGQKLRSRECPIHEGKWSGLCSPKNDCPKGCGMTGWIPEPEDGGPPLDTNLIPYRCEPRWVRVFFDGRPEETYTPEQPLIGFDTLWRMHHRLARVERDHEYVPMAIFLCVLSGLDHDLRGRERWKAARTELEELLAGAGDVDVAVTDGLGHDLGPTKAALLLTALIRNAIDSVGRQHRVVSPVIDQCLSCPWPRVAALASGWKDALREADPAF